MTRLTTGFEAEALVSRQLELWRVRQAMLTERSAAAEPRTTFGPYVALSRDFGSGGAEIARRVAERLGWGCFDREIVEAMAERAHLREEIFESLDERGRDKIEDWMRGLMEQSRWLGQDTYRHYLLKVLNTIALHGYAVLIGRGAHLLLPPAAGLRVRITAPFEQRVRRVAEREKIGLQEARGQVTRVDEERRLFLRHILDRRMEEFIDYDLAVNLAYLKPEAAVGLIVQGVMEKTETCLDKEHVR